MIILFLLSLIVISASEDVVISDTGIFDIKEGDVAVIFYLTVENTSEKEAAVSVSTNKCCDKTHSNEENNCDSMYLLGGYMGILKSKQIKNVTLIYPNLYVSFRQGTCWINVNYRIDKCDKNLTKMINFRTNNSNVDQNRCSTVDLDPQDDCRRVDCVVKYGGQRSYFDPIQKECQHVPICLTDQDVGYSWINNQCIDVKQPIRPYDIDFLDQNQALVTDESSSCEQTNKICHRGEVDASSNCTCFDGWKTTLSEDDVYEPNLLLYHMCNVEIGSWNCVNKNKIQTTVLIVAILAVTVASKVIIIMCILSWCYRHFKKTKVVCIDKEDYAKLLLEDPLEGHDECICESLRENVKRNRNVDVSYYPCNITPDTSRSRANKEKEFSIDLGRSTSSSNEDTTENEDDIQETNKSSEHVQGSSKKAYPEEESETTDYTIHLSHTTSSNVDVGPTDSTESEEYVVDFTKTEERNKQ